MVGEETDTMCNNICQPQSLMLEPSADALTGDCPRSEQTMTAFLASVFMFLKQGFEHPLPDGPA